MPRAIAATRLVEWMREDERLAAKMAELKAQRDEKRAAIVGELKRRGTDVVADGYVIVLVQQTRAVPSLAAARQRLAERPELLARMVIEVLDNAELKQLHKTGLLDDEDLAFIAPTSNHGAPYPVLKAAPK
jgi:predicted ester cyclase